MIIIKADKNTEAASCPTKSSSRRWASTSEETGQGGIMLAGRGPPTQQQQGLARRPLLLGSRRTVVDGPVSETTELIAGFWLWQCRSKEEASSDSRWVKALRPNPTGHRVRDTNPPGLRGL
jgi:hypothetical protein